MYLHSLTQSPWPLWKKVAFRFYFTYLLLQIAPWTWLDSVPGIDFLIKYYSLAVDWAVYFSNEHFFSVKEKLIPLNGSGDTSYGWVQVWLFLSLSIIVSALWSLADRKRESYFMADYWLRNFVRYFISINCLSYGIIKLFALQMPFPNLSQLATPLGDFLPMRLSWMFIGYSTSYQIFTGAVEVTAGLLLLNRKTITFGLLLAACVFANVVMMNLSYDIPVKIFSIHLFIYCLFLLSYDFKRLALFLLFNEAAPATTLYSLTLPAKWMRVARVLAKLTFVFIAIALPFYTSWQRYQADALSQEVKPIKPGLYDITAYRFNGNKVPVLASDTMQWKDFVFEKNGSGSVNTTDPLFRQRYRRGYFNYQPDTVNHVLKFFKRSVTGDSTFLFNARYRLEKNSIHLWATLKNDSVYFELQKSNRRFQLAERQFHWLSEYNR